MHDYLITDQINSADLNTKDLNGNTPLHKVMSKEMLNLFLEHGSKLETQNNNHETVLHILAKHHFDEDFRDWIDSCPATRNQLNQNVFLLKEPDISNTTINDHLNTAFKEGKRELLEELKNISTINIFFSPEYVEPLENQPFLDEFNMRYSPRNNHLKLKALYNKLNQIQKNIDFIDQKINQPSEKKACIIL